MVKVNLMILVVFQHIFKLNKKTIIPRSKIPVSGNERILSGTGAYLAGKLRKSPDHGSSIPGWNVFGFFR
jgi:hypothetical protein